MTIPEDLRKRYERAKHILEFGQASDPTQFEWEVSIIERIGALEKEASDLRFERNDALVREDELRSRYAAIGGRD